MLLTREQIDQERLTNSGNKNWGARDALNLRDTPEGRRQFGRAKGWDIWLGDLPEEMFTHIVSYLTLDEQFELCIGGSRCIPQFWGVTLVAYSNRLKEVQGQCESQGILTEIASESQVQAQELWWQTQQGKRMLLEDERRYRSNPVRFEMDVTDLVQQEKHALNRFQATVGVLADVMAMWSRVCTERDQMAKRTQRFHLCISKVFGLELLHPPRVSSSATPAATPQVPALPAVSPPGAVVLSARNDEPASSSATAESTRQVVADGAEGGDNVEVANETSTAEGAN